MEWRWSLPRHSVILNNIVSVCCMPVLLDGSQRRQRHAFLSSLAYVTGVELTVSKGLSSGMMVDIWSGWWVRKFAWLGGTFFALWYRYLAVLPFHSQGKMLVHFTFYAQKYTSHHVGHKLLNLFYDNVETITPIVHCVN